MRDTTRPDALNTLGVRVVAAARPAQWAHGYGGEQSADRVPHARVVRAEGVEGVWVVQLVTYRVSVAHGLRKNVVFPFSERLTESSVARFGCQGAHAVLAPRGGHCEISVCTIA